MALGSMQGKGFSRLILGNFGLVLSLFTACLAAVGPQFVEAAGVQVCVLKELHEDR